MSNVTLLSTTTFTTSSSVVTDNVFTSTYDHYMIVIKAQMTSGEVPLNMFLRAGGGPNLTNKIWQYWDAQATSVTRGSSTNQYITVGVADDLSYGITTVYVFNPAVAGVTTKAIGDSADTASQARTLAASGYTTSTGAFDGFSIDPGSSTITGALWVYGFPKTS